MKAFYYAEKYLQKYLHIYEVCNASLNLCKVYIPKLEKTFALLLSFKVSKSRKRFWNSQFFQKTNEKKISWELLETPYIQLI